MAQDENGDGWKTMAIAHLILMLVVTMSVGLTLRHD